nr:MAK10-like protein [Tanacetum cinerariifolium]
MEAHLAPKQPIQVNKIASSCEICNGPHDTQCCMENLDQAFVDYASSRIDKQGGKWYTFKPKQNNFGETYNPSWKSYPNLRKKDPETSLLVGRGFLATANAVIDCRKAKRVVGEGITRSVFGVKEINLGEEEAPYWTTLGKKESYKPRPSSNGVGAQTPYCARKKFMNCHFPGEWEIARNVKINPFKDVLVFRRMVEFLRALPINLKGNMWESDDLIENPMN